MNNKKYHIVETIPNYEKKDQKLMVNNATNINKTNNYPLSQTTEHKKTTRYDVGNPGIAI